MKIVNFLKSALLCFTLLMGISSCEKDLKGPEGDQGEQGAEGVAGSNYNERPKHRFTITHEDWKFDSSINTTPTYKYADSIPFLTEELIDNSMILVYRVADSDRQLLPVWNETLFTRELVRNEIQAGLMRIVLEYKDINEPYPVFPDMAFEVVVLER